MNKRRKNNEDIRRRMSKALEECSLRGEKIASFLAQQIGSLHNLSVLDAGCNTGSLALSIAAKCSDMVGLDYHQTAVVRAKTISLSGKINASFVCGDVSNLPFRDNIYDVVILNGVLEWVAGGFSGMPYKRNCDPGDIQKKTLSGILRVLKKSGKLFLAIENRFFPFNLIKDTHTKQPLVAFLPRKLSRRFSAFFWDKEYVNYLYSYFGLKKMLIKAGFSGIKFFVPVLIYHFPSAIVPINARRKILAETLKLPNNVPARSGWVEYVMGPHGLLKKYFLALIALLCIQKLFAECFIVLAEKGNEEDING